MTEHKLLDATADVLPVGLQPTPFGEVWQALQQVAAQVWDVDPSVYRAGIAWLWYALRNPAALDADGLRPLLVAALISEQAPLVKDTQTAAELAEYLRLWRDYMPTYPKLEALYSVFAAEVEILPITAPGYAPPANTRLAFFVVIRGIDFDRPLTADEAALIAVRATPMGSHPVMVTELSEGFSLPVYPLRAGVPGISVENDAICEPVTPPAPPFPIITEMTEMSSRAIYIYWNRQSMDEISLVGGISGLEMSERLSMDNIGFVSFEERGGISRYAEVFNNE